MSRKRYFSFAWYRIDRVASTGRYRVEFLDYRKCPVGHVGNELTEDDAASLAELIIDVSKKLDLTRPQRVA